MSRRFAREGNIYRRKSGLYEARLRTRNGERQSVYGKTRAEVQVKLRQLQVETAGARKTDIDLTDAEWLDLWLVKLRGEGALRPRTIDSYEYNVHVRIKPFIGDFLLAELDEEALLTMFAQIRQSRKQRPGAVTRRTPDPLPPLDHLTVRQARAVLSAALGRALVERKIGRNPMPGAKLAKAAAKASKYRFNTLTSEQLQVLDKANEVVTRWGALWTFLGFAGLRVGEALALTWSDINMAAPSVHVQRSVGRVRGMGLVVGPTKTHEDRWVPLSRPGPGLPGRFRAPPGDGKPEQTVQGSAGACVRTIDTAGSDPRSSPQLRLHHDQPGLADRRGVGAAGSRLDPDHDRPLRSPLPVDQGPGDPAPRRQPAAR